MTVGLRTVTAGGSGLWARGSALGPRAAIYLESRVSSLESREENQYKFEFFILNFLWSPFFIPKMRYV